MKLNTKHIIFIIALFASLISFSQDKEYKGYRIEGDEVVFSFDSREYEKATDDISGDLRDFNDLAIQSVVVSGNFNGWSKKKWVMKKVGPNRYELRKKIDDFTDEFAWEFKFVVNNAYWAEPSRRDANITPAVDGDGSRLNVYNLKMFTAHPDENGNAHFELKGHHDAKKVILSGTFNRWNEEAFKMKKTDSGWALTLQLRPDIYEYKFIIDGNWVEDKANPYKRRNEFNGYNSAINIKKSVKFYLPGHSNAKEVVLSGSFSNWSSNAIKLKRTETGWTRTIKLHGGKHHYKFIVDGQWVLDPDNSVKEYDGDGNINSVCMVK
ncbi:hypothetical protein L1I30_02830 [Gillisia sp. M10.2A]|uniref:AMP-activated protein kinase glycogen-binding domain-containing protein n=1 Tax=Gillisia lutea TaxID=2909668 RepID=A0ABS9EGN3_9FLAO|nr:hypothetical protein [Gillisia lutea]MCF4100593.1 hypothetical protein [Gillisia lutea]